MKRFLAVVLSGALVFGAGMSVCAADAKEGKAAQSPAAGKAEGGLDSMLGGLMNSLGGEDGSVDGLLSSLGVEDGSVDGLLSSLGVEDGSVDGLLSSLGVEDGSLDGLLSSLGEEAGSLDDLLSSLGEQMESNALLGTVLSGLGIEEGRLEDAIGIVLGRIAGDGAEVDLGTLVKMFSDPEALKDKLSDFFAKGGLGAMILDRIASRDGILATVVNSLKGEDGGYDVEKLMNSLENATQKDGSLVIDGTEVPEEELEDAVAQALDVLDQEQ